jgi:hypothetical protein
MTMKKLRGLSQLQNKAVRPGEAQQSHLDQRQPGRIGAGKPNHRMSVALPGIVYETSAQVVNYHDHLFESGNLTSDTI